MYIPSLVLYKIQPNKLRRIFIWNVVRSSSHIRLNYNFIAREEEGKDIPIIFKIYGAANILVVVRYTEAIYTNNQDKHHQHTKLPENSLKKLN
jgi:hypothetical protein